MMENKYEVEISQTEDKMFIAAANKVKHSEHYLIELEKEKGEEILKEFNNNFQVILDNLKVISRRLVLLNPNINDPKRANTTRNRTRKKNFKKLNKRGNASQPSLRPGTVNSPSGDLMGVMPETARPVSPTQNTNDLQA